MDVCLAATWNPRGELPRLIRLLPDLLASYAYIVIAMPPFVEADALAEIKPLESLADGRLSLINMQDWSGGRRLALQHALDTPVQFIHYADLDRLLRWVETRREEWRAVTASIAEYDCLIIGRDQQAYVTHPQALAQTEAVSNLVGSRLLGRSADFSAGSKGFSRRAVEFLIANTQPGRPFGVDVEWPILLRRAGFRIGTVSVSGLDWESADRYQPQAADGEQQMQAAAAYDTDPEHWAQRTAIAQEIVETAFEAAWRPLQVPAIQDFDFESVFEVDDYMYFYQDITSPERTAHQVELLVQALGLTHPATILDLACGFGRHANRLTALGHTVTGIDLTPGFLEIARVQAQAMGVQVNYRQGDMRRLDFQSQFDAVLLLFTAFGYFDDDENLLVLRNIARALKPGGQLIFDIHNRDTFFKGFMPYIVTEKDGNLMIDRHTFDYQSGRLYNRRIVIRDGVRRDKPFFVRMYNPTEIKSLLQSAGLQPVSIYSGWEGSPLTADSRRMIIIAKKPQSGEEE